MKTIPVFFNDKMVVKKVLESPSPRKPSMVVEQWLSKGFKMDIKDVLPISSAQIKTAHSSDFVDGIMSGEIENGFRTKDKEVIDSLPYTSGSFLQAAKEALKNGKVAVSPTSGYHHATHKAAMGYCTFNGLMIAAIDLLKSESVKKIAILDCDHHYGNGTDDIINELDLSHQIVHITARRSYPYNAVEFFKLLPQFLESFKKCDIIFYQAGADCHINDPFGGFLTTEEMQKRDRIVFEFCKENNLPIVWNLAGGYQEEKLPNGTNSIQKVLDLHNNTMQECQNVFIEK